MHAHPSSPNLQPGAVRKALLCLFAATMALPIAARAAEPAEGARVQNQAARSYRIEAGPLASVLGRFAAASGVALSFDPASTRTLNSGGLQGNYTVRAGFAVLLAGTGLEAVEGGAGEFTLRKSAASAASASSGEDADGTLPAVRVVARAAPAPADADDRYQPTPDASTLRTTRRCSRFRRW